MRFGMSGEHLSRLKRKVEIDVEKMWEEEEVVVKRFGAYKF